MLTNRDLGDETMTDQDKMPTPVAWADLKVGETYWVGVSHQPEYTPHLQMAVVAEDEDDAKYFELLEEDADPSDIQGDPQGRPMIYASASDAVAAMKIALDQWLEGVGK